MEPIYKELTFKSEIDFKKWLQKTTKYHIYFEDKGQDFLEWFIDERGEVLHSNLQSFVWNGKMVDIKTIVVGKKLRFSDGSTLNYKIIKIN